MRSIVESILESRGISYFELPLPARLLLVTDGTVTELLEALVQEPIEIGLKHQVSADIANLPDFQSKHNITEYLERSITLRGIKSKTDWLYAESVVFHQLLTPSAQKMLIQDRKPIGAILREEISDNHRKMNDCGFCDNPRAADALSVTPDYQFLFRKYQVLVGPNPVMSITEWFPISKIENSMSA